METKKIIGILKVSNIDTFNINIEILKKNNINDIILYSKNLNHLELYNIGKELKDKNPILKIGYNFKNLSALNTFNYLIENKINRDYIWTENTYVGTNKLKAKEIKARWLEYKELFPEIIYIGGLLYSNQIKPLNTNYSILLASKYMEVVSTTYDDNINLVKIFLFKNILKEKPFCVVNNINKENIKLFFNQVNYFFLNFKYDNEIIIDKNLILDDFNELYEAYKLEEEKKLEKEEKPKD